MKLYILQFCEGGIPYDPEAFLSAREAGTVMAQRARDNGSNYDCAGKRLTAADWKAAEAGDLAYIGDNDGREEYRLWEIELPEPAEQCPACGGSGCPFCHGTGEVPAEVRTLASDLKEDR